MYLSAVESTLVEKDMVALLLQVRLSALSAQGASVHHVQWITSYIRILSQQHTATVFLSLGLYTGAFSSQRREILGVQVLEEGT
jgi:hypothetical protein